MNQRLRAERPVSITVRFPPNLYRQLDAKRAAFQRKAGVSLSKNDFVIAAVMNAVQAPIDQLVLPASSSSSAVPAPARRA